MSHACCSHDHSTKVSTTNPHAAHGRGNPWKSSALATLHCLTGCTIGEFLGVAIGVMLGLGTAATITLAVSLAFIVGFALTVFPLMRRESLDFTAAMRAIWLGEIISISVMELAENLADWAVGGMNVMSVLDPVFWLGIAAAIPAGFLAAWPVNAWLLGKELKRCHS